MDVAFDLVAEGCVTSDERLEVVSAEGDHIHGCEAADGGCSRGVFE